MSYQVGHWSHFNECFATFPHGRVATREQAVAACAVAQEDLPMIEGGGDVGPARVDPADAAAELASLLAVVNHEGFGFTEQGLTARAWEKAASEPNHDKRRRLVADALKREVPRRWSATAALAACVCAVTAIP
jgi:hypothetical protein